MAMHGSKMDRDMERSPMHRIHVSKRMKKHDRKMKRMGSRKGGRKGGRR